MKLLFKKNVNFGKSKKIFGSGPENQVKILRKVYGINFFKIFPALQNQSPKKLIIIDNKNSLLIIGKELVIDYNQL